MSVCSDGRAGGAQELPIGGSPESGFLCIPHTYQNSTARVGVCELNPCTDLNLGRDAEVWCMRKVGNKCSAFREERGVAVVQGRMSACAKKSLGPKAGVAVRIVLTAVNLSFCD